MSFEIGDIVEAVYNCGGNGVAFGFKKGQRFIVSGIRTCITCNTTYIDIGLPFKNHTAAICDCNAIITPAPARPRYDSTFFRKIEPSYKVVEVTETISEQIKELIQN